MARVMSLLSASSQFIVDAATPLSTPPVNRVQSRQDHIRTDWGVRRVPGSDPGHENTQAAAARLDLPGPCRLPALDAADEICRTALVLRLPSHHGRHHDDQQHLGTGQGSRL